MNKHIVHDNARANHWSLRETREIEPGQYLYTYLSTALRLTVLVSYEDSKPFTGHEHGVHLSVAGINMGYKPTWKQIQRVKTDFLGPEGVAVQYYPKESELLDINNTYHIWSVEA